MESKTERVKALFDVTEKYFGRRQFDIRIRVETVQRFTHTLQVDRVLDIGCGDGSISLPLLPRCNRLTLLDLSRNMLELARRRIPSERFDDVDVIQGDFMDVELEPQSFDLICCIGVLAHVDFPAAVITKIAQLAKPGACVILEFTDSFHFWNVPTLLYQNVLKLARPEPYKLNCLKKQQVLGCCWDNGLRLSKLYRYGGPPPGAHKYLDQEKMYRLTRYLFGSSEENRNRWMGNQFICSLVKTELPSSIDAG